MTERDERLDERLENFVALHRPLDLTQMEGLLDQYGIAMVCAYPEILFDPDSQLLPPGWWYRESTPGYPSQPYRLWQYLAQGRSPEGPHPPTGAEAVPWEDRLARASEAYRVLDELFSPARRTASYGPAPGRQQYGLNSRPGYS